MFHNNTITQIGNNMEDITLLQRVKDFLDRKNPVIQRDRDDLKQSRSLSSGFAFTEEDDTFRGKERAKIVANVLRPWINTVISSYTANPFGIGVKHSNGMAAPEMAAILDYVQDKCDFTDLACNILESVLNDGYAYVLTINETDDPETQSQYPHPSMLDSNRTFMDDCDDPTGADCDMAIYVSVIKKTKAESQFGINKFRMRNESDPFAQYNFVSDTVNYTTVATVYEVVEGGVQVSKLCHGIEIDEPVLISGMRRLPIVRIAGEKVYMPTTDQWHYRGAYWFVFDLLRVINYQMSLHAERVAAAPTAKMMLDARVIAGNEDDWNNINKQPKAYVKYNAVDETGMALPVPQPFPVDKDNGDLVTGVQTMTQMVTSILGAPTGEPPKNETEVSVLLRKSVSEATANRYIKSLCEGLEAIGEVILQWLPTLFDIERNYNNQILQAVNDISSYVVVVDSGPVIASQQSKTVAQLMAVDRLLASNPASKIIPTIIKNLDMPQEDKQIIIQQLGQAQQPVVDPAMQQAMAQKDQQIAQMQKTIEDQAKQNSALQIQLNEFVDDSEIKIRIAQMDNETKIYLKRLDLAAADAELQAKLQADFMTQQARLQNELVKKRMELRKDVPVVPVFNEGRFV